MAIKDHILIYDTENSFEIIKKIDSFSYDPFSLNFSRDSKILAYGYHGETKLWNLETLTEVSKMQDNK